MRKEPWGLIAGVALLAGCAAVPPAPPPTANEVLALPAPSGGAPESYTIGPRDTVSIAVFELERPGEFFELDLDVSHAGDIAVPFAGALRAEGATAEQLRASIARALRGRLLVDPQVVVRVKEHRSVQVTVTGAVSRPGVLHLDRNRITLLEALALAGGLSREAGTTAVIARPTRGPAVKGQEPPPGSERLTIDLLELLEEARRGANVDPWLPPGSTVHGPDARSFFVGGYVNRPGSFPYRRPTTVLQAIALAGGLDSRRASASAVKVKRPTPRGLETIEVDVGEIVDGDAPDVAVQPGDTVECGRTLGWAVLSETLDVLRGFVNMGVSAARF